MIKLYVTPSCLGCRLSRDFFNKNKIAFEEKDFMKFPFTEEELTDILKLTENGFSDIVSTRSKDTSAKKINDLTTKEAIELMIEHPNIICRPIIIQYNKSNEPVRLLVGYDKDDIQIFCRDIDGHIMIRKDVCPILNECRTHIKCNLRECKCNAN